MLRFLLWPVMRYTRYVIWTAAIFVAGATYAFLSTRDEIPGLGADGGPYIIEFWEPYVWTAAAFIGTKIVLRFMLRRFLRAANQHMARLRSGEMFGPRK